MAEKKAKGRALGHLILIVVKKLLTCNRCQGLDGFGNRDRSTFAGAELGENRTRFWGRMRLENW